MFELKNHPKMALVIDKFRNASSSSSKRTSQWLYEKMVEVIEINQLEENTQSVDKNLSQMGTKVDAAPSKPNKPGKGDKTPKGDKKSQPNNPPKLDKPNKPSKPDKPDKGAKEVDAARRVIKAKVIKVKVIRDSHSLRVFLPRRKRNGLVCIMPTTVARKGLVALTCTMMVTSTVVLSQKA